MDEVRDRLDVDIEREGFETVGGYLLSHLGRMPYVGETFDVDGLSFEVLEVERRRITKVRARRRETSRRAPEAESMKSGFVSFLGRPNAGKSTLLNRIVGQKLAIVSDKPQTTRTRVVGVKNYPDAQVVFVDTPGVHKPTHRMNVRMVDIALEAMREVDVVALVVDASVKPGPGDRHLLELLKDVKTPVDPGAQQGRPGLEAEAAAAARPVPAARIRSPSSCRCRRSTAPMSTRSSVCS